MLFPISQHMPEHLFSSFFPTHSIYSFLEFLYQIILVRHNFVLQIILPSDVIETVIILLFNREVPTRNNKCHFFSKYSFIQITFTIFCWWMCMWQVYGVSYFNFFTCIHIAYPNYQVLETRIRACICVPHLHVMSFYVLNKHSLMGWRVILI